MKKEIFITAAILAALAACVFLLSGCGGSNYEVMPISARAIREDNNPELAEKIQKMELDGNCLNCISMSVPTGCCGKTEAQFYGCATDYQRTIVEDGEGPADFYGTDLMCGGCYCANIPLYKDGNKPAAATGCVFV